MIGFKFDHVCLESYALEMPPLEVSSAEIEDRLSALYQRIGIPFGTLEKLSGIKTRRFWDKSFRPSQGSTLAAKKALAASGFSIKDMGALFNCSVTRDFFEPATATIVARNLEMDESSFTMDITNACIGFSNGILMLAQMIEAGVVKAGMICACETIAFINDSSIDHIQRNPNLTREQVLKQLPTFTLGSGAAAAVLCHESVSRNKHHIIGSVCRSANQHSDLCMGNADYCQAQGVDIDPLMETNSQLIVSSAAKLGGRVWREAGPFLGWTKDDIDHVFCHQVGRQVNSSFYAEVGLDFSKDFAVYPRYGNLVSCALPSAFFTGIEEKGIKAGEKIMLMGFGSGLNSIFTALVW